MKQNAIKALFVLSVMTVGWFSIPLAILLIVAITLAVLFGKANSIIEFSFGPLKAKLERELSDAELLVQKLRTLAAFQAKFAITSGIRIGRWPSGDEIWQFESAKRFKAELEAIGVSDADLKDLLTDLVWFTIFDAGHSATGGGLTPIHLPLEAQEQWKAARDSRDFMDPDKIEGWLNAWNQNSSERQQLIEDIRWMNEHNDVKDVDQYLRSKDAIEWVK